MKLSVYYGKITQSTAGKTGYVLSVNANGLKITGFTCSDENENEFAVDIKDVKSVKNKITYRANDNAKFCGKPIRLGLPVFDCGGEYIGKLTDMTVEKNAITCAHVGNTKYSADDIVLGDAVIIKNTARVLKSDVRSGKKVLIKRGTPLTPEVLKKAQAGGEYVQANLKSI